MWMRYFLPSLQVECAEGQSEATRRQELQREIEELNAELDQLNGQISLAETQLAADGELHKSSIHKIIFLLLRAGNTICHSIMWTECVFVCVFVYVCVFLCLCLHASVGF